MRDVMLYIVLVINVLSLIAMVSGILMHSGRGGGLSDMFGGGIGSAAAGSTVMEKNLDRITIVTAIVFMGTTILLAFRLT